MATRFFEDKLVVITGGSRGIGLATAQRACALGARVCMVARDPFGLAQARASLDRAGARGGQVETIACDCTDMAALKSRLEDLVARRGVPQCLVNCVGYARPGYVQEFDLEQFRRHMDVNYYGQLVPILVLLPHFLRARRGHITNVSSVLGFMGTVGYSAYCPSKFALAGLTDALRHELKPYGLTFSIVYPPDVDTPGYAEENRTKPPECRAVSARASLLRADVVAESILDAIVRKRFEVVPGKARSVWRMCRHFPGLVRRVIDRDYLRARQHAAASAR